jgi:hypothetical protein
MKQHDIWLNFIIMFTFYAQPSFLSDMQTVPVDFALPDCPFGHIRLLNFWTDFHEYWKVVVNYEHLLILINK